MLYRKFGKRALDLTLIVLSIWLIVPVLVAVTVLVRFKLGRPVIFRQERAGRGGQPFTIYKFRTMTDARDALGRLLSDSDRLTRFGTLLRALSLDELPELWNVVRGEMSLVGPRPLIKAYVSRYSARQARRLEVIPGLTGWAQVTSRNTSGWEERFEQDVWYVENQSLLLDLKILILTLFRVAQRDGVSAQGHATMYEFMGNEPERL